MRPSVTIVSLGAGPSTTDSHSSWTQTLALRKLKAQFPAEWLWEACNKALDDLPIPWTERKLWQPFSVTKIVHALNHILLALFHVSSCLRQSRLRSVLEGASDEIDENEDGFSGYTFYFWKANYKESLFQALIGVIDEHGLEGWKNVRWLVYDKVHHSSIIQSHTDAVCSTPNVFLIFIGTAMAVMIIGGLMGLKLG